nr:MAG TPA: hypothetical protein [Caudoviricetes sp.]
MYVPQCFEVVVCAFNALRYISTLLSSHNSSNPLISRGSRLLVLI